MIDAMQFSPFRARAPWWGSDLQTIRNHILHDYADLTPWPAEQLFFSMANGDRLSGDYHSPAPETKHPAVVLIHGFTGCADSAYILNSARCLLENGYPVVRLNLRGAGPTRADCCELYHAGRSNDLRRVIASLPEKVTANGLVAAGFSLGGNMLLKYLGEEGAVTGLQAAIAVSAPIDLASATRRVGARRNWIYHRWLVGNTKRDWLSGPTTLDEEQQNAMRAARTIYALDDEIVGPLNGFTGADDYYRKCSAQQFLSAVTVPTLIIHAADDPWIPASIYRDVDWTANDYLLPMITSGGGHVGFHGSGGRWHDNAIVKFLGQ